MVIKYWGIWIPTVCSFSQSKGQNLRRFRGFTCSFYPPFTKEQMVTWPFPTNQSRDEIKRDQKHESWKTVNADSTFVNFWTVNQNFVSFEFISNFHGNYIFDGTWLFYGICRQFSIFMSKFSVSITFEMQDGGMGKSWRVDTSCDVIIGKLPLLTKHVWKH